LCRALRVLCAAADDDGLAKLKRAAASAHWEVVGGATSVGDLVKQLDEWRPDVVVVDTSLGGEAVRVVRRERPSTRIVTLGPGVAEGDTGAETLKDVARAVLGLPKPGGPVRR
jgi:ActR/RegA family two-component response regulator